MFELQNNIQNSFFPNRQLFKKSNNQLVVVSSEVATPPSVDCPDSAKLQERKLKETVEDSPLRHRNLHLHKTGLSEIMVSSKQVPSNR